MSAKPYPDVQARLTALLEMIQRYRRNHYPASWDYGPLPEIERAVRELLEEM